MYQIATPRALINQTDIIASKGSIINIRIDVQPLEITDSDNQMKLRVENMKAGELDVENGNN